MILVFLSLLTGKEGDSYQVFQLPLDCYLQCFIIIVPNRLLRE